MTDNDRMAEKIAAYLDGQMDAAAAAAFEDEVAGSPLLAAELERLAANDALLRRAFAPAGEESDAALAARMGLSPSDRVVPLPRRSAHAARPARWRWAVGGAVAAGLALAIVLPGRQDGRADAALAAAMERAPSRTEVRLADGATVMPLLTFQAGDGRYCREFVESGSVDGTGGGIACRDARGWRIEAKTSDGARLGGDGAIAPAAGPDGGTLDAAYARLAASDPLGADAERRLLAGGWQGGGRKK